MVEVEKEKFERGYVIVHKKKGASASLGTSLHWKLQLRCTTYNTAFLELLHVQNPFLKHYGQLKKHARPDNKHCESPYRKFKRGLFGCGNEHEQKAQGKSHLNLKLPRVQRSQKTTTHTPTSKKNKNNNTACCF